MKRLIVALVGVVLSAPLASAQTSITFRGDSFVRQHESLNANGGLLEFVPPGETVQNWTQLVGYRAMLDNSQSPVEAATIVGRLAAQRYPGAKPRVLTKGGEAMVDFVLVTPRGLVELNVFKYARGPNGRGVVSLQYARRFRGLEPNDVRGFSERWINEAAGFDMNAVRKALTPQPQAILLESPHPTAPSAAVLRRSS